MIRHFHELDNKVSAATQAGIDGAMAAMKDMGAEISEVTLSPELAEYRLYAPQDVRCWRAGTGYALADWLRSRGHEPQFFDPPGRS